MIEGYVLCKKMPDRIGEIVVALTEDGKVWSRGRTTGLPEVGDWGSTVDIVFLRHEGDGYWDDRIGRDLEGRPLCWTWHNKLRWLRKAPE